MKPGQKYTLQRRSAQSGFTGRRGNFCFYGCSIYKELHVRDDCIEATVLEDLYRHAYSLQRYGPRYSTQTLLLKLLMYQRNSLQAKYSPEYTWWIDYVSNGVKSTIIVNPSNSYQDISFSTNANIRQRLPSRAVERHHLRSCCTVTDVQ